MVRFKHAKYLYDCHLFACAMVKLLIFIHKTVKIRGRLENNLISNTIALGHNSLPDLTLPLISLFASNTE